MQSFLSWYCDLFGYAACSMMSTFEALVLFALLLCAVCLAFTVFLFVLALIADLNR